MYFYLTPSLPLTTSYSHYLPLSLPLTTSLFLSLSLPSSFSPSHYHPLLSLSLPPSSIPLTHSHRELERERNLLIETKNQMSSDLERLLNQREVCRYTVCSMVVMTTLYNIIESINNTMNSTNDTINRIIG